MSLIKNILKEETSFIRMILSEEDCHVYHRSISNPINTHSIDTHLANDEGSHRHIKNIIHSVLANSSKNYDPIHYHIDGKLVRSVTAYTHKPSGQVFDHTVYHGPEGHESITSKSIKVFQ